MKPTEYLDAVKGRLNIQSDYELAKRLNVGNGRVVQMRKGERPVPVDVAFKIAITLELDPATVVADLEAQREKNPQRREFWAGFISHAKRAAAVVLCMLVWSFSGISGVDQAGGLGGFRRPRNFA